MRIACLLLCLILWPVLLEARAYRAEVTLEYVASLAEERASRPYGPGEASLHPALLEPVLDYDRYRMIQFRGEHAFWGEEGSRFRVEFFHPGYLFDRPVQLFEFSDTHVQPIPFNRDFFDYGGLEIERHVGRDSGYAGFRLLYPLNDPDRLDEVISFIGSSYYRALGAGQRYGISARGLALDTAQADRPEEFPHFTDFWLGKPASGSDEAVVYALLDSVSGAGAYRFRVQPGETTVVEVEAVLFFREDSAIAATSEGAPIRRLGLAPLTSMFLFGESSERRFDDYRPEVHDSDGLLIRTAAGEAIWRPLANPRELRRTSIRADSLQGFGLLQRDREFSNYKDIFHFYHLAPSLWIEPVGDWGEGSVELVEIASESEGVDNIVAFWNPRVRPEPMQPFHLAYRQLWTKETDLALSTEQVIWTRFGAALDDRSTREVHIEFDGPELRQIAEGEPPQVLASASPNASILDAFPGFNPVTGAWRAVIRFQPQPDSREPVDLRVNLQRGDETIGETWQYLWEPR
jgi:periplasmic glucans biosynthesis protein